MSKNSPLMRVRTEHGSKDELVKKVLGIVEASDEEEKEEFEKRIGSMSNRKLLRLWDANQTVSSKWGDRSKLAAAIASKRFPGGNDDYQAKISTYSLARLVDLARQHRV